VLMPTTSVTGLRIDLYRHIITLQYQIADNKNMQPVTGLRIDN